MRKPKVKEGLRSGKPPKEPKAKAAKAKKESAKAKQKKAAEAVGAAMSGNNMAGDPKLKQSFLSVHRPEVERRYKALQTAQSNYRKALKAAKAEGFTKDMFDYARKLESPEGEEDVRQQVIDRLQIANWMGADIGEQLSLFMEPSRVPLVDRARKEGERDSMENKPRKCDYHASTPAYKAYMEGYEAHQTSLLKTGIQPLDGTTAQEAGAQPN